MSSPEPSSTTFGNSPPQTNCFNSHLDRFWIAEFIMHHDLHDHVCLCNGLILDIVYGYTNIFNSYSQLYMLLYMAQLLFSLCNTWKDPVHIFGMVGLTSALVWPRDLLTYHGIRRWEGWEGRPTLRAIESICRTVPLRLKLRFTGVSNYLIIKFKLKLKVCA